MNKLAKLYNKLGDTNRAVQLLWLNLAPNGFQDVALAFEGGEPGAMKRQPREPNEKYSTH